MPRRILFFALFALSVSAGCVRLGVWQVSRLRERQARNAAVLARLIQPPLQATAVGADTAARFRRVLARGRYDYEREMVLASRPRSGSPGVHILTPMVLEGSDTVVLVNRGWVYAADGMRVDLARWREPDSGRVDGFADQFSQGGQGAVSTPSFERAIRRLERDSVRARIPGPLLPFVLVQQADSGIAAAAAAGIPVRVEPPPLSEGSHRAYAVQWFGFAAVGFAGTAVVLAKDRRTRGRDRRRDDSLEKG